MFRSILSFFFATCGILALLVTGYILFHHIAFVIQPTVVLLSALENGTQTPGAHMILKDGVADYQNAYVVNNIEDSSKINYVYFPIISRFHPEFSALQFAANAYGGLLNLPQNSGYGIQNFKVLVRDYSPTLAHEIPKGLHLFTEKEVHYLGNGQSLPIFDQQLLAQRFRGIDFSRVMVMEIGRSSPQFLYAVLFACISIFCFLANILVFPHKRIFKRRQYYHGLGMKNPLRKDYDQLPID